MLAPDAVTDRATEKPSDAVTVVGYLGKDNADGYYRVYETAALAQYLLIRGDDILDRYSETGGDDLTSGRSVIWVKSQAKIALCNPMHAWSLDKSGWPPGWPPLSPGWPIGWPY